MEGHDVPAHARVHEPNATPMPRPITAKKLKPTFRRVPGLRHMATRGFTGDTIGPST